jgi:hypothetical protein
MRTFAAIRSLLRGREAAATRESLSKAFDVGSEVSHGRLGHGTIVRVYDNQKVASAEVLFGNGNVRSCAATSLTKSLPRQPLAGRGKGWDVQAASSPNPLNAAR